MKTTTTPAPVPALFLAVAALGLGGGCFNPPPPPGADGGTDTEDESAEDADASEEDTGTGGPGSTTDTGPDTSDASSSGGESDDGSSGSTAGPDPEVVFPRGLTGWTLTTTLTPDAGCSQPMTTGEHTAWALGGPTFNVRHAAGASNVECADRGDRLDCESFPLAALSPSFAGAAGELQLTLDAAEDDGESYTRFVGETAQAFDFGGETCDLAIDVELTIEAPPDLPTEPCADEGSLYDPGFDALAHPLFLPIDDADRLVYRLDEAGQRQLDIELDAGVIGLVYATRDMPLVITDPSGTCLQIVIAKSGLGYVP